jgi:tetratricopeptide (TPR) repeat protein
MSKKIFRAMLAAVAICGTLFLVHGGVSSGAIGLNSSETNNITFMNELDTCPEVTVFSTPLAKESCSYVASDYIYNNFLSSKQRNCYDYVYQAIVSRQNLDYEQPDFTDDKQGLIATLDISGYGLSAEELAAMWVSLLHDHIELYYVDETLYSYTDDNVSYLSVVCPYKYNTYSSRQVVNDELDKQISVLKELTDEMSDGDKASYVCTYLANLYSYAKDDNGEALLDVDSTMISGILNKSGICAGYSRVYAFLCRQLGLECLFVTGEVQEGYHAWDEVEVNGGWYAVDPTFVDSGVDGVLLAGKQFTKTHFADPVGVVYGPNGMQFGYPLPELEEYGYFESTNEKANNSQDEESTSEIDDDCSGDKETDDQSPQEKEENPEEKIPSQEIPSEDTTVVPTIGQETEESPSYDIPSPTPAPDLPSTPDPSPEQLADEYYNLACQAQAQGDLETSVRYYKLSLSYHMDHGALFNLANALRDLREYSEAVNYYVLAYSNGDGLPAISNCLNMLQDADITIDERLSYDEYIVQYAPIPMVYLDIAQVYVIRGDTETAQRYISLADGM